MTWIGYVGLAALAICWVPQSIETIKGGRCEINLAFLVLYLIGSIGMLVYAMDLGDLIFSLLNGLTTVGALLNLFYKIFPRVQPSQE